MPRFPGDRELVDAARKAVPEGSRLAVLAEPEVSAALAPLAPAAPALAQAPARSFDAIVVSEPVRIGPLLDTFHALHDALASGGVLIVRDVVWRTAPTPDLARVLAPPREKVRPIEGYEMQLEHAGFRVEARVDLERDEWLRDLAADDPRRPALNADHRHAARVCIWTARRTT